MVSLLSIVKNILSKNKNYINSFTIYICYKKKRTLRCYKKRKKNKKQKINENLEKIYCDKLNEKYFKIKESLSRCGNKVIQFEEKEEVEKIINSFFNTRKELNKI